MNARALILCAAALACSACAADPAQSPSTSPTPTQPAAAPVAAAADAAVRREAPDFTLRDTHGAEHRLSSYRGKVVVLEWVNHGCPFVKKHYGGGNMQALQRRTTSAGVVWLSICSSAEGKQGFMDAAAWNDTIARTNTAATAVLLDAAGDTGRLYGARTTPHMFVIDAAGRIAYEGAIDDRPTSDAADIPAATNHVAAAVDAVLAGKPVANPSTKPYGCSVKYAQK